MKSLAMGVGVFALVALALVVANHAAWAQTGTASIYGEAVDPKGLAVVGAKVTLTNVETGATRTVETDATGVYLFPALPPGKYSLRVEMAGFRASERRNVELLVNTTVKANAQLEIGAVTETVQVIEAAAPLNTTDATMGNVLTPQHVSSLPLEARSLVALLTLQPGVVFSGDPTDPRSGSVSGGRSDQSNVTLDGIDINDQQTQAALTTALPIPSGSIQEFRFTTSNPNADQGRSSGGQVGFVTKSGTNDFHGSIFWSHRNTITTANDFFNNSATPRVPTPKLIRNQFGGALGGPIVKDRFFFFGTYEGTRVRTQFLETRVVPTDTLRQGILKYFEAAGNIVTLTPADMKTIDFAGIGVNPAMLPVLQAFPHCNDFTQGLDATGSAPGLNFCGFRFNAPIKIDNNIWVARFDVHVTRDAKHILSWRGTLGDLSRDFTPQQFPGQPTASQLLDNSKGHGITYSAQLRPSLTSVFRYGYTRQGRDFSGQANDAFSIRSFDRPFSSARGITRIIPTHNLTEDLTWLRGKHTFQFGTNLRRIRNNRSTFANSFPAYAINDGFCRRLCNDLPNAMGSGTRAAFPKPRDFNPFKRAAMALYGTITQIGSTFLHDGTTQTLVTGAPVRREFFAAEYEFYGQDTWRLFRGLTVTLGLRYGYYGVPHEANGDQTQPTVDVMDWFFSRVNAMNSGVGQSGIPLLSWDLNGPVNNKPSWYRPDKNNFAPSFSFAYTPSASSGWLAKIFGGPGKSVIRGGFRVVYDRVGGAFVTTIDTEGAVGLVTNVQNRTSRLNYSGPVCPIPAGGAFCAAPRFTGFRSLPPAANFLATPAAGFPSTLPQSFANRGFMVDNDLRTPYSYAIQFSYGRELPGGIAVEAAYVGRLGHKLLAKADVASPLVFLRDPASGMTIAQAMNQLFQQSGRGAKPISDITPIPFFEKIYAPMAGTLFAGSTATQAVYDIVTGSWPSFTDSLIDLEFAGTPILGFPTYFQPQSDSMAAWTNLGRSNYHALQFTIRKRFTRRLLFDFNYTFSKSMDNASAVENSTRLGGQIADIFNPKGFFSVSDFDIKHQMTANWVYELPFGRGRFFGSNISTWADRIIGGWQTSGIIRWRGAFPTFLENGFNFPTNFFLTGPGTQICPINTGVHKNAPGGPNLFGATNAEIDKAFACQDFTAMGSSGSRNSIRGAKFFNLDFGLQKTFNMPWESHKLVFGWQVFNLPNHPNFDDRTMRTNPESRPTFGRYVSTIGGDERANNGRVMQFGLHYEF